jgi:UDP-2,4-diacetamido-2,4,6-trideoxy-beta-L-altropyranose hydrolase
MVTVNTIVFRADASVDIGTGHVMRCLTLAQALRKNGARCSFVTRALPGNLSQRLSDEGFDVTVLPAPSGTPPAGPPAYAAWAGVDWSKDAMETRATFSKDQPDWLVLDHYAFDARWQRVAKPYGTRLMVIDDLADRPHDCDLLLDQNLGQEKANYKGLVPDACTFLMGPQYALLRPDFLEVREQALARRAKQDFRQLLITMGGVDRVDATSVVLGALRDAPLPKDLCITVVMGSTAPALKRVQSLAKRMPWPTEVVVDVTNMAMRMAAADLAISTGGGTTWERLFLQLPSLVMPIADNQVTYLKLLERLNLLALFNGPTELLELIAKGAYRQLSTDAGVEYGTPKVVEEMCKSS